MSFDLEDHFADYFARLRANPSPEERERLESWFHACIAAKQYLPLNPPHAPHVSLSAAAVKLKTYPGPEEYRRRRPNGDFWKG